MSFRICPAVADDRYVLLAVSLRFVFVSWPVKRAMEIALGPGKSVMMNAFMMYMSGAGIHIFSIMITFMGILTPSKAILNVHGGTYFTCYCVSCCRNGLLRFS